MIKSEIHKGRRMTDRQYIKYLIDELRIDFDEDCKYIIPEYKDRLHFIIEKSVYKLFEEWQADLIYDYIYEQIDILTEEELFEALGV